MTTLYAPFTFPPSAFMTPASSPPHALLKRPHENGVPVSRPSKRVQPTVSSLPRPRRRQSKRLGVQRPAPPSRISPWPSSHDPRPKLVQTQFRHTPRDMFYPPPVVVSRKRRSDEDADDVEQPFKRVRPMVEHPRRRPRWGRTTPSEIPPVVIPAPPSTLPFLVPPSLRHTASDDLFPSYQGVRRRLPVSVVIPAADTRLEDERWDAMCVASGSHYSQHASRTHIVLPAFEPDQSRWDALCVAAHSELSIHAPPPEIVVKPPTPVLPPAQLPATGPSPGMLSTSGAAQPAAAGAQACGSGAMSAAAGPSSEHVVMKPNKAKGKIIETDTSGIPTSGSAAAGSSSDSAAFKRDKGKGKGREVAMDIGKESARGRKKKISSSNKENVGPAHAASGSQAVTTALRPAPALVPPPAPAPLIGVATLCALFAALEI
ncbi:hypothetical protein C8J57DRAFT_1224728 [Mycena rebaudengoi]|nr:hypothetical protein C8J57DRAFT_1224728 [Mycena rebaudengoi]